MYLQQEKAVREHRIRELEAELDLQTARAEATATALRMTEDQRAADTIAAAEQHREELAAAHSELKKKLINIFEKTAPNMAARCNSP